MNNPALSWSNAPAGTETFQLVCIDLDAGGFLHWSVGNIPNATTSIAAQARDTASNWPAGTTIGVTDWGSPSNFVCQNGWGAAAGPGHTYQFQIRALNEDSTLLATATLNGVYPTP